MVLVLCSLYGDLWFWREDKKSWDWRTLIRSVKDILDIVLDMRKVIQDLHGFFLSLVWCQGGLLLDGLYRIIHLLQPLIHPLLHLYDSVHLLLLGL